MMELFCVSASNMVTTSRVWLLSSWYEASATKELNFKFYSSFINLNLNSYMGQVAAVLADRGQDMITH